MQVKIAYVETMLEFEEAIQSGVNELGQAATQEALGRFDTDGAPLEFGGTRFFSKGAEPKEYQTPYGPVSVNRHVYQTAQGGKTFCPLEHGARIILTSTPKFAKMVSSKDADLGGSRVQADLRDNHGRPVARSFIQNVSEAVSAVLEAKADQWHYQVPQTDKAIHSVAIGLDGTTLLLGEQGYCEAMVGTLALDDKAGERQHTIYLAASPEYGKARFLGQLEQEIGQIKQTYPQAH